MTMPSGWAGGNSTVFSNAGIAKAWVNFNGTGTVAIRASFNVSSITDNGTGNYTVNFATAMQDVNYSIGSSVSYADAGGANRAINNIDGGIYSTFSVQFLVQNGVGSNEDSIGTFVQIFR